MDDQQQVLGHSCSFEIGGTPAASGTEPQERIGSCLRPWLLVQREAWDCLPRLSRAFLSLALVDACLAAAFVVHQLSSAHGELLHVCLIMLLTTAFFLVFSWDAIAHENNLELQAAALLATAVAGRVVFYTVRKVVRQFAAGLLVVAVVCLLLLVASLALAYVTYTQFGWRQYSKLACDMRLKDAQQRRRLLVQINRYTTLIKLHFLALSSLFIVVMVIAVREAGHQSVSLTVLACATLVVGGLWELAAYQALRLEHRGLVTVLEVLAVIVIILPLADISLVHQAVGGASHTNAEASLMIAAVAVIMLTVMVAFYMHVLSTSFGLLVEDMMPDYSQTHPELVPLMQGAWLGKPSLAAPLKRRFFQLSADGSTLRWSWHKFVLLYYTQGLRLDADTRSITLEMGCDPDLCLRLVDDEQYQAWKIGLTSLLQLLFTPGEMAAEGESAALRDPPDVRHGDDSSGQGLQGPFNISPSKMLQKFGVYLTRRQSGADLENQHSLPSDIRAKGFGLQPVVTSTPAKLLGLLQGSPRKCPQGPDGEPLSPAISTSVVHINAYALQEQQQPDSAQACTNVAYEGSYSPVVHDNPSFHQDGSPASEASTRHSAYDTAAESPSAASPFAGASVQWGSPMSSAPSSCNQSPVSHRHGFQHNARQQQLSRFARPSPEFSRQRSTHLPDHPAPGSPALGGGYNRPESPARGLHPTASMASSLSLRSCGSGDCSPSHAPRHEPSSLPALQMAMAMVPYAELAMRKHLGQGAQGEVWAAWCGDTPVAVKHTRCAIEVAMNLQAGLHDNIVGLRALTQAPDGSTALVMEYCPRGTLDGCIHQRAPGLKLPVDRVVGMVRGIVRGMLHLHTRSPPILHRDLKPANIFIGNGFVMKIGDFGMSRTIGGSPAHRALFQHIGNEGIARQLTPGVVGTVAYSAPELLACGSSMPTAATAGNTRKLLAADVYSFGVTLWEMLHRKRPYDGMDAVLLRAQFSMDDQAPPQLAPITLPDDLSSTERTKLEFLAELVKECTNTEATMRPSFKEISNRFRALEKDGKLAPA